MSLESVTHISDLNVSNPPGTDTKAQGDDHIRNVKTALRNDFPNINGACNFTPAQANLLASIAALTVLANGTNGAAAPSAIAAASDGQVFRRSGTALAFGAIDLSNPNAVARTIQTFVKPADTARNTTIVLADDPDLVSIPIEANKLYRLEMLLMNLYAGAGNGMNFRLNFSQAPQDSGWVAPSADVAFNFSTADAIVAATNTRTQSLFNNIRAYHAAIGFILSHATNAGVMALQWCQFSSNAINLNLLKGSHIVLTKLN
jgi:hypothetical protein